MVVFGALAKSLGAKLAMGPPSDWLNEYHNYGAAVKSSWSDYVSLSEDDGRGRADGHGDGDDYDDDAPAAPAAPAGSGTGSGSDESSSGSWEANRREAILVQYDPHDEDQEEGLTRGGAVTGCLKAVDPSTA
jgi:hypothetical protein